MTLRIIMALSLLVAGMAIASISFWRLADNETFRAVMSLAVPTIGIVAGVTIIASALVIVAHETRLTDWLKEKLG
jgi:hypothetical protein